MIDWEEAGSGPPVVLVHGFTEDRHVWHRLVPRLTDAFRCVLLDLRGHGASPMMDDLSAPSMAADVAEVVAAAGIEEPPLVIGHSLGAVVASIYATQASTRGVVNVDQSLRAGDFARELAPFADALRGPDYVPVLHTVFGLLGMDKLGVDDRRYVAEHVDALPHEVLLGVWGMVLDMSPDDLNAFVESVLPGLTVPYLAVHGSDPGDDYRRWLEKHVPSATLEVWDGLGHFIPLVDPKRLATRIKEFAGI